MPATIHPVVRQYRNRKLLAEHHIAENLENEWDGPSHREPLSAFLGRACSHEEITVVAQCESGERDVEAIVTRV